MSYLVSMDWVKDHLHHPEVIIIDCRFILGQPHAGRKAYEEGHLPGAFYLDLEQDLSSPIQAHGGRHPLPDPDILAQKLGRMGIDEHVHVVIYDDQGGAMASRCWWLLTYLGHPKTQVMKGTFHDWSRRSYPVTAELPHPTSRTFVPRLQQHLLVSMEEVKAKLHQPHTWIIDSREEKRYLGEEEPIDRVAGHIPGAKHYFWKDVQNEQGKWKDPDQLSEHFCSIPTDDEVIVYCGSGVTATPNVLSLYEAGYQNVKLYAGSWSDWISYSDNPIATGKENDEA